MACLKVVDPCGFCSLRAKFNSVLCIQHSKTIHERCSVMKSVTQKSQCFTYRKYERNNGETVEQEEKLFH